VNPPIVVPRPAATVILARDTSDGIEVFMMQRTTEVAFAKGMHVFPGGGLDPTDHHPDIASLCVGLTDVHASTTLGIEQGGLAYWIAAIRECFEEAGLLLGYRHDDELVHLNEHEALRLADLRIALAENKITFVDVLKAEQFRVATDKIAYFSHWITMPGRPKRYDTRFFVAQAPVGQVAKQDDYETVGHRWVRPADAIEKSRLGEIDLMFPTIKTLETLSRFATVQELLEFARAPKPKQLMTPRTGTGRDGKTEILIPGDYAYAELGKIDPEGKGVGKTYIEPGIAVEIAPDVLRVTAPNPGMMTGPGTNSYLIGNQHTGVAVIDPGPPLVEHIEALINAARGPIKWILCTHTHLDHSPAALELKARTGATVYGMPPPPYPNQDQTFAPEIQVTHRQQITVAGVTLRVIHTPGHASNQVCYLHEAEHLMFTGDHIMQGSTVVINPPDGNMAIYLASLRLLLDEQIAFLAPGHGFLMDKPNEAVERLLIHRQDRENKVLAALRTFEQPATLEELVPVAYRDTAEKLHKVAMRSLFAHLQKLVEEQRVEYANDRWLLKR
jgi:glyoxylase-like metal-dependent hydrolase (beta-lactamase superfamily II)/8-oxo-dGTP pyrophosphatase MutT (NUDIX family)